MNITFRLNVFIFIGYRERACAIFQAQMELSVGERVMKDYKLITLLFFRVLYPPPRLDGMSIDATLDALEEFWEAEAPRIGESNARGWAVWDASKDGHPSAPPTTKTTSSGPIIMDPYSRWAAGEIQRDALGDFPRRTSDEDDDPYTTILFADIRPFLFRCSSSQDGHEDLRIILLFSFMHFLGLHLPGLSSLVGGTSWDSSWSDTRFGRVRPTETSTVTSTYSSASTLLLRSEVVDRGWEVIGGTVVATEKQTGTGWGPVKEWGWDCFMSPLDGFGVRGEGRMWESGDVTALESRTIEFIRYRV